jgi:hypothetical protein
LNHINLYEETFIATIKFLEKYPNTLYCYGNHDVSYEWEALETGYSQEARATVLRGIETIREILPKKNMAFIHRIDDVLFSHAGLTELFVTHFFPDWEGGFDELLQQINTSGKEEMWCDVSPIWARPQDGQIKLYPEGFLQVAGHTPVKKTDYFRGFLSVDNFSTHQNGTPVGDQKFVWVDTTFQQWGFVDKGDVVERLPDTKTDIRNYRTGDWVLFCVRKNDAEEPEFHEGVVEIIDRYPGGYASIDVMCKDIFYKHIPLDDVLERITVGISGDTCVIPPLWKHVPGEIVERLGQ